MACLSCNTASPEKPVPDTPAKSKLPRAVYIPEENLTPTVDLPGYTLLERGADHRKDATAIMRVKRSWPLVMQSPSREGFDSLLTENFSFTDHGKILTREAYIQDRIAPSEWKITHVVYRNVTLQFMEAETAILTYQNEVTNTNETTGEVELEDITWIDVYTLKNNTWKISAAHVVNLWMNKL